ncbi:TIM22 inner membrane protein import complex anchor subunit Tim18 [Mucor ambiguus]|uniref:Succinate dehydrogenase [ubiquinone] cytochrome b small subunit n=1 Tax=Mucor ambiguus TaxID=91626 RepID=A0A0C9LVQ2_9FUNG|nr:TIM22 inner membrane protein import complex anchor subunit Tim18 [Mucor ambiguus]
MALRLANTPALRSTARLLVRQHPMGLVKIHSSVAQSSAITTHKPDRLHGSYHWDLERAASLALVPIIASQLAYGASPVTDVLLGVVLPVHLHIGWDACITDYFNARKSVFLNKLMTGTLWVSTTGVLVGCYQFNTNDIGLTEFISKLWA